VAFGRLVHVSPLDPSAVTRLRRLGGERLLREMLELFLQLGPERLTAADAASGDVEAAERACHSLKSAAGNVGATTLQAAAAEAERAAGARDRAALAAATQNLRSTYAAAETELRKLLEELGP
jgi:HPt (histidine-containing phosphotransfer) domain-containing protein